MRRAADAIAALVVAASVVLVSGARAQEVAPAPGELTALPGALALRVTPRAIVLVDNKEVGEVEETRLTLPAGIHRLRIVHADYEPLRRTITIRAGEDTTLAIDLAEKALPRRPVSPSAPANRAAPSTRTAAPPAAESPRAKTAPSAQGELRLSIRPESQIWVDDELKGSGGNLTLQLPVGRHSVRVVHPDYQPLLRRVVVGSQPATLTLDLAERGIRRSTSGPQR